MPRDELLAAEKEALGLYVSSHPLQDCRQQLARAVTCGLASLADRADSETVTVGGIIGALKNITTRRGEPMMFIRLDDLEGSVEVVVVPAVMAECRELWSPTRMVLIAGRVDQKGEGETKLVAQIVKPLRARGGRRGGAPRGPRPDGPPGRDALGEFRRLLVDHAGSARWWWTSRPAPGGGGCASARSSAWTRATTAW